MPPDLPFRSRFICVAVISERLRAGQSVAKQRRHLLRTATDASSKPTLPLRFNDPLPALIRHFSSACTPAPPHPRTPALPSLS